MCDCAAEPGDGDAHRGAGGEEGLQRRPAGARMGPGAVPMTGMRGNAPTDVRMDMRTCAVWRGSMLRVHHATNADCAMSLHNAQAQQQ